MSSTHPEPPAPSGTARRFAWSTLDQAFSSGSNFVLIFLLARSMPPGELGLAFIGYSILTVGIVLGRDAFGAILAIELPRLDKARADQFLARSLGGIILCSVPVSGALFVYTASVPLSRDGMAAMAILAAAAPVLLVQDLQRFWAVADGRPHKAALADGIWLITALAGFWLTGLTPPSVEAASGSAIWAVGCLAATLSLARTGYWLKPRVGGSLAWARSDARRRHLASDSLIGQLSPLLMMGVVAGVGGPQIIAAIRAAGTLFGPLNLVSATIPMAVVPEAIRSGPDRARLLFLRITAGFAAAALLWGLIIRTTPAHVGSELLGDTFPLAQAIILITATEYVGLGMWAVSRARFRAQQRLRLALQFRIAFSASAVVLPIAAVLAFRTSHAVAASLAATTMILGLLAYASSRYRADPEATEAPRDIL